MTKLNQILAVEKGALAAAEETVTKAYHAAQKRQLFDAVTRTYRPKDDEGERLPPEGNRIVETVPNLVKSFEEAMVRLMDVTAVKVWGNTKAKADVVLPDGRTVLKDAPVEYLLFLEKQLSHVQTFLGKLPTLDPSIEWHWDESTGTFASLPTETHRTKKIPKAFVKAQATDKHPAQVEMFTEDETVGYWTTVKFSSAVPVTTVNIWRERARELAAAVKMARETANSIDVEDRKVGAPLLAYVFAAVTPTTNGS